MKRDDVKTFEDKNIRTVWDSENEKWFISIVDVVSVLTDSINPTTYWRKLKQRLKAEGNQTVTNCHGLKMLAKAFPKYIGRTEQLLKYHFKVPKLSPLAREISFTLEG